MQFHLKFFLTKRVATITIKYPDLYDFKKVCIKIIAEFPRELADCTVSQSNFRDIMEKHIMIWSEKAYVAKEPVRFIGLQVSFKIFSKYKMYKIKFHYRSMFLYRLYSEFGGKTTHPASSISLQFFEPEFCKRLTKTVGPTLWNFHILYPFFSF